jgi:hypothetical protein
MKAITAQNINKSITAREVVTMNFISNMMIKDNDIRKSNAESKRIKSNRDHGLNLYNAIEFSKEFSNKTSQNQYFDLICNKII